MSKLSADQKKPFQDRIDAKTAELDKEKQVIEAASQNSDTQTDSSSGAGTSNNTNNDGTNDSNDNIDIK